MRFQSQPGLQSPELCHLKLDLQKVNYICWRIECTPQRGILIRITRLFVHIHHGGRPIHLPEANGRRYKLTGLSFSESNAQKFSGSEIWTGGGGGCGRRTATSGASTLQVNELLLV